MPGEGFIDITIHGGGIELDHPTPEGLELIKNCGFSCPHGKDYESKYCMKSCFNCILCG